MGKTYRVLDLFAGIGGLSLGFEMVNSTDDKPAFELVCAVEMDQYACETFKANLKKRGKNPDVVIQADLTDPKTHEIIIEKCNGSIDIIIGGPPCQSFSYIGTRSAPLKIRNKFINDERDQLYLEYIALVRELKPVYLVFENVKGILTKRDSNGKPYINLVTEAISECGYELRFNESWDQFVILNAADYGVPQIRERVFIIANNLGKLNQIPKRTHSENGIVPDTLPYVTIYDAIGDLPELQAKITLSNIPEERLSEIKRANEQRYSGEDIVPYNYERFWSHYNSLDSKGKRFLDFIKPKTNNEYLTAHVARGQQLSDIELFGLMPPGSTSKDIFYGDNEELRHLKKYIKYDMNSFHDKYKKHAWDRPCSTIFAHMQKDGNRFIHPDSNQARTFTVRETARIQSFPDDFIFTAPGNIRYKHIGNAVPPIMAKAIAEEIYRSLSEAN